MRKHAVPGGVDSISFMIRSIGTMLRLMGVVVLFSSAMPASRIGHLDSNVLGKIAAGDSGCTFNFAMDNALCKDAQAGDEQG